MTALAGAATFACLILVLLRAGGRLRTIPYEFSTKTARRLGWFLLFMVIYAAVALPAVFVAEQPSIDIEDLTFASLFAGHSILALFLLAWWTVRRPIRPTSFLYLEAPTVADVSGGLLLGMRVWAFTLGAALLASVAAHVAMGGLPAAEATTTPADIPDIMIWMAELPLAKKALLILSAMTVEEAFFRAFLQSRIGLWSSSLLFAIAHISYGLPTLMIGVFVVSLIIGWDFAKHRKLARSIIAHGVFDAIQLIVVVPLVVQQVRAL